VSTFAVLILLLAASGVLTSISLYLGVVRLLHAGAAAAGTAMALRPARFIQPTEVPGAVRLPRFDLTALRTAASSLTSGQRQESKIGNLRFVLRDAGQDHLGILADYASDAAGSTVLPITVVTAEHKADYLLIFRAESPGRWVAAVEVPGFRDWADVFIRDARERTSLTADDAQTVARSVRAAPDPWVPAWQAVEQERPEGDPVREAIGQALRSS
jgi:hypothetical protein